MKIQISNFISAEAQGSGVSDPKLKDSPDEYSRSLREAMAAIVPAAGTVDLSVSDARELAEWAGDLSIAVKQGGNPSGGRALVTLAERILGLCRAEEGKLKAPTKATQIAENSVKGLGSDPEGLFASTSSESASTSNNPESSGKYDSINNDPEEGITMATATKTRNTKAAKRGAKAKSEDTGQTKRAAAAERDLELQDEVYDLREEQGLSWGDIAEKLSMQAGKAMLLHMRAEVAANPKLKIRFKTDEELAEKIVAARDEQDLSWGQIMARAGITEGKARALYAEASGQDSKGSNVAIRRAAAKEEAAPKGKRTATKASAKPAAKGAKRGGRRGRNSDPS